jgi:hypothetical protein
VGSDIAINHVMNTRTEKLAAGIVLVLMAAIGVFFWWRLSSKGVGYTDEALAYRVLAEYNLAVAIACLTAAPSVLKRLGFGRTRTVLAVMVVTVIFGVYLYVAFLTHEALITRRSLAVVILKDVDGSMTVLKFAFPLLFGIMFYESRI